MKPKRGLRFWHSRVLAVCSNRLPQLYQVTRVTRVMVYFAPVYDYGAECEELGKSDCCSVEYFPNVVKELFVPKMV